MIHSVARKDAASDDVPRQGATEPRDGEALRHTARRDTLTATDRHVLDLVLQWYFWLLFALQEATFSLKRLRVLLFGAKPHTRKTAPPPGAASNASHGSERWTVLRHKACRMPQRQPMWRNRRLLVSDALATGGRAPRPTVAPSTWSATMRPWRQASAARCVGAGACIGSRQEGDPAGWAPCRGGALCPGKVPVFRLWPSVHGGRAGRSGADKYSARARAVLVLGRYYLGVPLYRLEGYQAMVGVPVADATQWDQIERVADCAYPVFEQLKTLAAQGEVIYQDDTHVRILSLIAENRRTQADDTSEARTGMYTTGLVVQQGEHTICLYMAGRAHAGENLEALLTQRDAGRDKPLVMSDALAANTADEAALIRCHCLAHGRRKFSELEETFPAECTVVIEAFKQVFEHDEAARLQQLTPTERLAYHQHASGPIMAALKSWLEQQFEERNVEPNSSLGKAFQYLLNHWQTLTQFLQVERAPLDNNIVERALKLAIRQRKNSLFYATDYSAYIASMLTSLIATCLHAGVNALEYLVALQEHRAAVFHDPDAWLPWNYQANLAPP